METLKRSYDKPRLLALAESLGLSSRSGRLQCPARCHDDPRGCKVDDSAAGALFECKRCGAAGSVLDLVMAARDLELREALELLGATPLPAPKPAPPRQAVDGAKLWDQLSERDHAGEAYLRGRGLEAAIPFVRFNTGALLEPPEPAKRDSAENFLNWAAGRSYRVALALQTPAGRVMSFQIRATASPGNDATGAPRATKLSLKGVSTTGLAFGDPAAAATAGAVFFTEGIADTLALLAAGQVVVGASGSDQIASLEAFVGDPKARICVLCPQNDTDPKVRLRSQDAFVELAKALRARGGIVRTLATPAELKDPAAWLERDGLEALRVALARVTSGPRSVPSAVESPQQISVPTATVIDGQLAKIIDLPDPDARPLTRSYGSLCQILRTPALSRHLFGPEILEFNEMLQLATVGRVPITDGDFGKIRERCEAKFSTSKKASLKFSTADIAQAVDQVARERTFHPVAEYLEALKWDGTPRLNAACGDWLMADMTRLNISIVRSWFISAVARALKPGCKVDNVLILVGPQGYGKSEVFRALAGPEVFSDSPIDLSSKDAFGLLQRVWILEWSELESLKRARDAESVKSFLSSRSDTYRAPYGRVTQTCPRRCVIVGTSNEREVLGDATGNRRYWIITVRDHINVDYVRDLRDQLWAEAVAAFRLNTEWDGSTVLNPVEPWWLDDTLEPDLLEIHRSHEQHDAWEDAVVAFARAHSGPLRTSEVLEQAIQKPPGQWTKADEQRIGLVLRRAGYDRQRVTSLVTGDRFWAWVSSSPAPSTPF